LPRRGSTRTGRRRRSSTEVADTNSTDTDWTDWKDTGTERLGIDLTDADLMDIDSTDIGLKGAVVSERGSSRRGNALQAHSGPASGPAAFPRPPHYCAVNRPTANRRPAESASVRRSADTCPAFRLYRPECAAAYRSCCTETRLACRRFLPRISGRLNPAARRVR